MDFVDAEEGERQDFGQPRHEVDDPERGAKFEIQVDGTDQIQKERVVVLHSLTCTSATISTNDNYH